MADTPRQKLADALTTGFPDFLVVPVESAPDNPDRTMLVLKQKGISKLAVASQAAYTVSYYVTVVSAIEDIELAEPDLDTSVLAVWEYLDSLTNVSPGDATKGMYDQSHLGYDIETDLTVQKG